MKSFLCSLVIFLTFTSFTTPGPSAKKFSGTFSNGMKGDKISFVLSADGKRVQDVTFQGYWRCSGRLEMITIGPESEKGFPVVNGKVDGVIVEPEDGGSTAFRFELHGIIKGNKASGTYRMNINALGCDSYKLNWTATAQ
jgi:hypothetical protein